MKKVVFTLLLTIFALYGWGQESQTGYNFLRLPVSAHAAALGGDNITVIDDDPSLGFSNPALAASVSDMTIGVNYMNYMSGANVDSASFNKVVNDKLTWAVGAEYINYGSIKEFDENGVQTGTFSANDIAVSGTLTYLLLKNVVGGITPKFIYSSLGSYNSIAIGVDLGLNWYEPDHDWSVSLVAKNLGGQLKAYDDKYEKMPIDVQAGVSKRLGTSPLRVSLTLVDLTHYNYRFANHIDLGLDVLLSDNIWIGGGYNFRRVDEMKIEGDDGDESSHMAGLSLGFGINLDRFKLSLAYGKYHVSSGSLLLNFAYTL